MLRRLALVALAALATRTCGAAESPDVEAVAQLSERYKLTLLRAVADYARFQAGAPLAPPSDFSPTAQSTWSATGVEWVVGQTSQDEATLCMKAATPTRLERAAMAVAARKSRSALGGADCSPYPVQQLGDAQTLSLSRVLLRARVLTPSAQSGDVAWSLPPPLEVARASSSALRLTNPTATPMALRGLRLSEPFTATTACLDILPAGSSCDITVNAGAMPSRKLAIGRLEVLAGVDGLLAVSVRSSLEGVSLPREVVLSP